MEVIARRCLLADGGGRTSCPSELRRFLDHEIINTRNSHSLGRRIKTSGSASPQPPGDGDEAALSDIHLHAKPLLSESLIVPGVVRETTGKTPPRPQIRASFMTYRQPARPPPQSFSQKNVHGS
jgi:hypothetical protein